MPKISGFELLELLDDPPVIIFSTAYDEFAIRAFDLNAVDYPLKPYSQERFNSAVDKAKRRARSEEIQAPKIQKPLGETQPVALNRIVVKTGNKIHIVAASKINFIEAMDDYIRIHTEQEKHVKQQTMKFLEARLEKNNFVRIHRSYILALRCISKIEVMEKSLIWLS